MEAGYFFASRSGVYTLGIKAFIFLRLIPVRAMSAEPNNQTAAGAGTGDGSSIVVIAVNRPCEFTGINELAVIVNVPVPPVRASISLKKALSTPEVSSVIDAAPIASVSYLF